MPNGLCTHSHPVFWADGFAWMQIVPQHSASLPGRVSVPSTDTTRLEPLESAAQTYWRQLWLFDNRHHYLATARSKLNTVGVKSSIFWLKQHCYHVPEFVLVLNHYSSVSGFHTPSRTHSTVFYSCWIEITYPDSPKWVPHMLYSKQRLEELLLRV